jgi:hypothetical protein
MKVNIQVTKEVDVKEIHLSAGVRYWEDAEINGENIQESGDSIPCRVGDTWSPIINIGEGKIINWEHGKTASIHFKVCDCCSFRIIDTDGGEVMAVENDYVPKFLCPKENGYGDYIIMDIDENGFIADWHFDENIFVKDEE